MPEGFEGRGLLAFSDPAGAKACLGLAAMLVHRGEASPTLVSNRHHAFYADWSLTVEVVESFAVDALPQRPDWIFTGTSHPDSSKRFELGVLQQARAQGIPSTAFVDHWTNLRLRFVAADGSMVFPDQILLPDEKALALAVADGLPAALLQIAPNPYLEYIRTVWQPQMQPGAVWEAAGVPSVYTRYVLYAPDPISLRNGDGIWPFDEGSALADIAAALKDFPGTALLVKPHPLQPPGILTEAIAAANTYLPVYEVHAPDNLELARAADLVIGFHSNFLLEAQAIGKKIVRYFPAGEHLDAIAHLATGCKVTDARELMPTFAGLFR